MPRIKLSEHKSKQLIYHALQVPYSGISLTDNQPLNDAIKLVNETTDYVVKVDQGVKKRMKQGLVRIGVKKKDIGTIIEEYKKQGFTRFIIEELVPHEKNEETYISFEREREGISVHTSRTGGIDIEENAAALHRFTLTPDSYPQIADSIGVEKLFIKTLHETFDRLYFSFMEINPLLVTADRHPILLDAAVMADSAAEFFVTEGWSEKDMVDYALTTTPEEEYVAALKKKSQAALSLTVINRQGSIFMLLSGGGASLVLADEVYNLGAADKLANYGEYSGNPNEEETYLYAQQILSLMKKSRAKNKCLIIGGGVANFTDVRVTFNGIVRALEENINYIQANKVRIFVRRGGPHQKEGLARLRQFMEKHKIAGAVYGPELPLQQIVQKALNEQVKS